MLDGWYKRRRSQRRHGVDTVDYSTHSYFDPFDGEIGVWVTPNGLADDGNGLFDLDGEQNADNVGADVENIIGSNGADHIFGTAAPNRFAGHGGADVLVGDASNDVLEGGDADDVLRGDAGNDTFDGGTGADDMDGGADNDTFAGGDADDVLTGAAGNDTFDGGAGADDMDGDAGNDTFDGGAGADDMDGGADVDTATYASRQADLVVRIDNNANDGEVAANEGDNVRQSIENVRGGRGDDVLVGSSGPNQLLGEGGNDSLNGRLGADTLDGQTGVDTIVYSDRTTPVAITLDEKRNDGSDPNGDGNIDCGRRGRPGPQRRERRRRLRQRHHPGADRERDRQPAARLRRRRHPPQPRGHRDRRPARVRCRRRRSLRQGPDRRAGRLRGRPAVIAVGGVPLSG